ncbi:MAG: MvaI/BcnI family restriction endonuclease [Anaerolineaceae bacterium]|nr:MvaI/BcnI family restriction endonuclease [Anaerolineaceae bacterium]
MYKIYSKTELLDKLKEIRSLGWIENKRYGNSGSVGNTLEDLLEIPENNLPIPNANEWELKCQRQGTSSLITLFHFEPSPRVMRFVPNILLPKYGWKHKGAGINYPSSEMSFRQTLSGMNYSDRGFKVIINRNDKRIEISFSAQKVQPKHKIWLEQVEQRIGLNELSPQPYWGFSDIFHKAGTKLLNTFYIVAEAKKNSEGTEFYKYNKIIMLSDFDLESLLYAIEFGYLFIDFDSRTGHNHGTKFRLKQDKLPTLYKTIKEF